MNRLKKGFLLMGFAMMLPREFSPPWVRLSSSAYPAPRGGSPTEIQKKEPAGYALIFDPPKAAPMVDRYFAESVKIDFERLFVQWILTGLVVGAALVYFKDSQENGLLAWWNR